MVTAKNKMRKVWIVASLVTLAAWATPAPGQTSSVWDGAYTDAQARHGAIKYRQECAMCHGPVLEGNGEAPPLVGRFIPDWEGTKLSDLFEKIQATMPLFAPGTLSASDTADLLAFVLQANGFPTGHRDLEAGDGLTRISFDAHKPVIKEPRAGERQ